MLTDRKKRVLEIIIDGYIHSGEPVGSRSVAKDDSLGISSATVRNEMADLEEFGLIEQPHTSAGRIPSDAGLRYYIDHIMVPGGIQLDTLMPLLNFLDRGRDQYDHAGLVRLLSECAGYTAMMLLPEKKEKLSYLAQVELTLIEPGKALLVVLASDDKVHARTFVLPPAYTDDDLKTLAKAFNEHLRGLSLTQWSKETVQKIIRSTPYGPELSAYILEIMSTQLMPENEERVYLSGVLNLLEASEFQDLHKVKFMLHALEDPNAVEKLMGDENTPLGLHVKLGEELALSEFHDCALVMMNYHFGAKAAKIGVLGPKRLRYAPTLALLNGLMRAFELRYSRDNMLISVSGQSLATWKGVGL